MSLIRKHGAVLQAWACLDLVKFVLDGSAFQQFWQRFEYFSFSLFSGILINRETHVIRRTLPGYKMLEQ